ncbi:hypothetical protein ABK040_009943 [Willaertia magna]
MKQNDDLVVNCIVNNSFDGIILSKVFISKTGIDCKVIATSIIADCLLVTHCYNNDTSCNNDDDDPFLLPNNDSHFIKFDLNKIQYLLSYQDSFSYKIVLEHYFKENEFICLDCDLELTFKRSTITEDYWDVEATFMRFSFGDEKLFCNNY